MSGLLLVADGSGSCGHCGRVYNPYLGDRFWSGSYACTDVTNCVNGGETHELLCDDCHRSLVRA